MQYPDFVAYGTNLLEASMQVRPDFEGMVHPIWEMSRRLLQSYTNGVLKEELKGFQDRKGILFDFLTRGDFNVDGYMPIERPHDKMEDLPSGRKRKQANEGQNLSRPQSPAMLKNIDLPELKPVTLSGPERAPVTKKNKSDSFEISATKSAVERAEAKIDESTITNEKGSGRGSRSEPYSQEELCSIYIARKVRMLDWDTISWGLSRFKTPTVAMLADARAAFDEHHDLILDTLRLCCWPEDSMYLVVCAANVCMAAIDRGSWAAEVREFKNNRGELYHVYMQRRLERVYRKSFETPEAKRSRRKRERAFGYEALSIDDFSKLPEKKKAGGQQSKLVREPNKVRRRRTKEEMLQMAEEKAAARALLKANGLKANGEAITDRRKVVSQFGPDPSELLPPTFAESDVKQEVTIAEIKPKKAPRRKYDIPELERIAFAGDVPHDRRLSYDLEPDEHRGRRPLNSRLKHAKLSISEKSDRQTDQENETRVERTAVSSALSGSDTATQGRGKGSAWQESKKSSVKQVLSLTKRIDESDDRLPPRGTFATSTPLVQEPDPKRSPQMTKASCKYEGSLSPAKSSSMSITSILDRSQPGLQSLIAARGVMGNITGSFESAAAAPFSAKNFDSKLRGPVAQGTEPTTPRPQGGDKPRSSMSLAALLN